MISEWDLVKTKDGYYGIVTNVEERCVYQTNGVEVELSEEEFKALENLPQNFFQEQGHSSPNASFIGIFNTMLFKDNPFNPYYTPLVDDGVDT